MTIGHLSVLTAIANGEWSAPNDVTKMGCSFPERHDGALRFSFPILLGRRRAQEED
jgi:hypothetical protein